MTDAPAEPTDPTEPAETLAPAEPVEPVEQVEQVEQVEHSAPVDRVEPVEAVAQVEPLVPQERAEAIAPVDTPESAEAVAQVEPPAEQAEAPEPEVAEPVGVLRATEPVGPTGGTEAAEAVAPSEVPAAAGAGEPAVPGAASRPEEEAMEPERFRELADAIEAELAKVMVGQREVIRATLLALIGRGHVLLEGVPGLGKTVLVRSLASALHLGFARVQFTPDLMPGDVTGSHIVTEDDAGRRRFEFQPGPLFTNLLLADEINRATPKTQSALLEAMQERQVTTGDATRALPAPFFVLATQNPIEHEGTYPLPEAQLDRFFFKLVVPLPSTEELVEIAVRTTGAHEAAISPVATGAELEAMAALAREVPIASHVLAYAARIVAATHPDEPEAPEEAQHYLRWGSSPRGMQTLVVAARVRALWEGRYNVAFDDVAAVAPAALRHRVFLNFEADAAGVDPDAVVAAVLAKVKQE